METKGYSKSPAAQIKILANQKFVLDSDINTIPRVPCKNKYRNGVLMSPQEEKKGPPSMEEPNAKLYYSRSLKFQISSTCSISLIHYLERVPTNNP